MLKSHLIGFSFLLLLLPLGGGERERERERIRECVCERERERERERDQISRGYQEQTLTKLFSVGGGVKTTSPAKDLREEYAKNTVFSPTEDSIVHEKEKRRKAKPFMTWTRKLECKEKRSSIGIR
ncbi:unnamed protein product [Musa acuminata subsp. malaccensis]|uniref:(wild Malaysian banana) hypothetical protein n=1 Tax=Musa acuminata subsp. malaccensis TaxID=214687 RepID=A0A804IW80_MUSAM|nr:unnamed protein product [Musa acuminata subsp. malaccensis]